MNTIWKWLIMISAIVIADQLTKGAIQSKFYLGESITLIEGFFNFTYVRNSGAAFGFMAKADIFYRKILFIYLPVLACFWLVYLMWACRHSNKLMSAAYALILAGAIGNLWDRITLGYVVDFLDFYIGNSHFPAFNIADSSISIAFGLIVIDYFRQLKTDKKEAAGQKELVEKS